MQPFKFDYVRLDGHEPTPYLRSKTRVMKMDSFDGDADKLPERGFDGSSTRQAEGSDSDRILKPVRAYPDLQRSGNSWLVMCEVRTKDGEPDPTEDRATILENDDDNYRFGFEQEYVLAQGGKPLGFPAEGYPEPQGKYYCSVGADRSFGREIVEQHLDACLGAGIDIFGINGEVLPGQREYQVFAKGAKKAGDDLWISRFLMHRIAEQYGVSFVLHPKPVKGDWNGSGMHCNFSTTQMREQGGEAYMTKICEAFAERHDEHIAVYGAHNDQRLTGKHETQSIDTFSYGVADRGASIRIPLGTVRNDWKGRLEDRRVAANADPYQVCAVLLETMKTVEG